MNPSSFARTRTQTWGQSQPSLLHPPQHQGPTPGSHFPRPGTYLHAVYIDACPHAKLLAKEPQPGHAVEEAVIELGRKTLGLYVCRTQESCAQLPSIL